MSFSIRLLWPRWWLRSESTASQHEMLLQDWDGEREETGTSLGQPSNIEQIAVRCLMTTWNSIRPACLRRREKRRLGPTSWLDGVRGFAALFVTIFHYSGVVSGLHSEHELSRPNDRAILRTPILSLIIVGAPHVDLFFVISGFALSYRPLHFAREQDTHSLHKSLASAMLRRGLRLFVPAVAIMLVVAILGHYGTYFHPDQPHDKGIPELLRLWLWDVLRFINPFDVHITFTEHLRFGPYLWTIPVEFRASFHVFVVLMALSQARNTVRLVTIIIIELWLIIIGQNWDILLFNTGMLICEIHWRRTDNQRREGGPENVPLPLDGGQGLSDALQIQSLHHDQTNTTRFWLEECRNLEIMAPTVETVTEKSIRTWFLNFNFLPHRHFRGHILRRQSYQVMGKVITFLFILYVLSMPDDEDRPGFEDSPYPLYPWIHRNVGGSILKPITVSETLSNGTSTVMLVPVNPFLSQWSGHTNPGRLHVVLSAAAFIFFVDWTPTVQKFFTLGFSQHLGEISYSLYLIQFLLWEWIGKRMWAYVMYQTSLPALFSGPQLQSEGEMVNEMTNVTTVSTTTEPNKLHSSTLQGREMCFILVLIFYLPILLYAADLVTRFVDKPSINLAKRMEKRFFTSSVITNP